LKKYKKNYLEANGFTIADFIPCENCGCKSVDIHHLIFKSQGGKDSADNLIALCRKCHEKAHNSKEFNNHLKELK